MEKKLTHFDTKGNAVMVDVGDKDVTTRTAVATGKIRVNEAVMKAVMAGTVKKGDVLGQGGGNHGGQADGRPDTHVPYAVYFQVQH